MQHMHRTTRRLLIAACSVLILAVWGCSESPMGPGLDAARASETESPSITQSLGSNFVTVHVEATVSTVKDRSNLLGGAVSVGDPVSGFYVYDLNAVDTDARADRGTYLFNAMPCRMSFEVSGLTFMSNQATLDMEIKLRDGSARKPKDKCDIKSVSNMQVLPGVNITSIKLSLADGSGAALAGDALVDAQTDLSDWPTKQRLQFKGSNGLTVTADVGEVRMPMPRGRKEPHSHDEQDFDGRI